MERLTIPDKKIDGGVRRAFIDVKAVKENAMTIYWALKRYEDTGLAPPEIIELKERDTAKNQVPSQFKSEMVCPVCGSTAYPWNTFCDECGQRLWDDEKP